MGVGTITRDPGGFGAAPSGSYQALERYARAGLWALPVYGLANFVGTLSSQPDYKKAGEFPAYARYITTSKFLASHLVASMLGTGIGLLGFTALFVYLASRSRAGVALAAFVTTILGNMGLVALFGVAVRPAGDRESVSCWAPRGDQKPELSGLRHTAERDLGSRSCVVFCRRGPLCDRHLRIGIAAQSCGDSARRVAPDIRHRHHHGQRARVDRGADADGKRDLDRA